VRVGIADGHDDCGTAQQGDHVGGIAEIPQYSGEVSQCGAALLFVLLLRRRAGRLAAVFLVDAYRPVW
jgi:hypothetical protein